MRDSLVVKFINVLKCLVAVIFYFWMKICRRENGGVILYYHGVSSKYADTFRKQISYLAKRYEIVNPTSILHLTCRDERGQKRRIAITFDDAFKNVLDNAVPILKHYHAKAAVCVPTGHIGKTAQWSMDPDCQDYSEPIMSRDQICLLDQQGFEIYSHTVSHCPLAVQEQAVVQDELEQSKAALEDILGHDVVSISYPHGSVNQDVVHLAEKAGYKYGFTIEPSVVRQDNEPLRQGRVSVSLSDSMFVFGLKAAGAFHVEVYLRRWKNKVCEIMRYNRQKSKY
jgi:peptidoglycan/xylan/chitin deacetylase (PgdA/CDA1 family)